MKTLKLRGAARYTVMKAEKQCVERNQTISVEDDVADKLLAEQVMDKANHEWPVWEDVTPEKRAVKKTTVRRKRRSKAEMAENAA